MSIAANIPFKSKAAVTTLTYILDQSIRVSVSNEQENCKCKCEMSPNQVSSEKYKYSWNFPKTEKRKEKLIEIILQLTLMMLSN